MPRGETARLGDTGGAIMKKPGKFAVATAVFLAGIGNAFIYVMGYALLVVIQFVTGDSGDATLSSASTSFVIALMFTLLLSTIITFLLAFPIATVCRAFGFTGKRSFLIAPAVGAALACWIASVLDVALTTYIAIVAFAYITAAIMWLTLKPDDGDATPGTSTPAAA